MNHWLVKSEPEAWSFAEHVKAKTSAWTGVRNAQASNHMKAMKKGDLAFFYHTGDEKQIVGIVRVTKEYHPDETDDTGRFGAVTFEALQAVPKPVTLAQIKAEPKLQQLALVRQSRLSVMPIDDAAWTLLCKLAGMKK